MTVKNPVTPFDKGQAAAREGTHSENPFTEGSIEFNNFELGYRFGLQKLRTPALGGVAAVAR